MEITGKIKVLKETETIGNNGFKKREIVVDTDEQYSQPILVEFIQDKCELLNGFSKGQHVKIYINLRGREWINPEGVAKYFNAIQGWRIESLETNTNSKIEEYKQEEPLTFIDEEEDGDLPF